MDPERTTEEGRTSDGRYYAEHVRVGEGADPREHLQGILDAAEGKKWHLLGVAGGLPDGGMILFWDTERPSFGKTSRR